MTKPTDKLLSLRQKIQEHGLSAYLIPSNDEFMNEYVPFYARRLEWLTGFSGSAGMAVVLKNKSAFFTDGRYILQAAKQLPKGQYEIINTADIKPTQWLRKNISQESIIGLNPTLYSKTAIDNYKSVAQIKLCDDLIDGVWPDKPSKPLSHIYPHLIKYSGQAHSEKVVAICNEVKAQGAEFLLLTAPDSICWLLNIRGGDVPNTPLVLARLLLKIDGTCDLFVDTAEGVEAKKLEKHIGKKIKIHKLNALSNYLRKLDGKRILLDSSTTPYSFYNDLAERNLVIESADPCILPKAYKNKVEINGAVDAHVRDGVAVSSFLYWLGQSYTSQNITEISAAETLLAFRRRDSMFVEPSFDTIAGFAENGAVIHYKATIESNKKIKGKGLFLLDSGGQYLGGTTDITRTIAIGTPSREQKRNFTLVLKGHIAVANTIFPEGTTGHQIDILARKSLWQYGLDYDHGTGHGVGSFLGVHEGPQRISKAYNDVMLMPGMIISNEPGYYKNGEYGIRIENLIVVEEMFPSKLKSLKKQSKRFFRFKTLTCVPIDHRLIDFSLLNSEEKLWLKNYHAEVCKKLAKLVDKKVAGFLQEVLRACS